MKNLQEATERICELKGSQIALSALMPAVISALPDQTRQQLCASFDAHAEAARVIMLHADISDVVLATFERDVARDRALLGNIASSKAARPANAVDALLMTTVRVRTFAAGRESVAGSGFFFRRGEQLFLVSNASLFADPACGHVPDRIEFSVHTDARALTRNAVVTVPLFTKGQRLWRAADHGGDLAAIAIAAHTLPSDALLQAFDEGHLASSEDGLSVGEAVSIVGFPAGFVDHANGLPVLRSASLASAFGVPFQQQQMFLIERATPASERGSPVVRRLTHGHTNGPLAASSMPWQLIGVLANDRQTESDTLNGVWYADALLAITKP